MHLEKGTFGIFPAHLTEGLKAHEQAVLAWLWHYANQETRKCWPSQATLARKSGMGTSKLNTTLNLLEEKGLVIRKRRVTGSGGRQSTVYYLPLQRGDTHVRNTEEPTPQGADEPKGQNQKKFLLAPYLDKWMELTGGTLHAARCAKGLKDLERVYSTDQLLQALENYIQGTDKKYLSIHRFMERVGIWTECANDSGGSSLVVSQADLYD